MLKGTNYLLLDIINVIHRIIKNMGCINEPSIKYFVKPLKKLINEIIITINK